MNKRTKEFIITFFIVGIATFIMYYLFSQDWVNSAFLGFIGGSVVAGILSAAVPFIKKQRDKKQNPKP